MSITIQLEKPIVTHEGPVASVTLREPQFAEIMRFGEPFSRGYATDGSVVYSAENSDAIKGYIETLVQQPVDGLLLRQLGTVDSLKLKDALIDFFTTARSKLSQEAATRSKTSGGTSTS
jgi:DNA-binding LacI/PurR family transcriptional regulator